MKGIHYFLLICIVAITTACPRVKPDNPEALEKIAEYEIDQLEENINAYNCANFGSIMSVTTISTQPKKNNTTTRTFACTTKTRDTTKAKLMRDAVVHRLIRLVDYNYFEFENDLYVKRSTGSFLADAIDMSANFAATITNGERAKTIINAALITFRGTRKSGSIHYFQEQTADVLITKMQTSRNRVLAEVIQQLDKKNVDDYSLDAALGDVIRYFYAGTLPRALQELKTDTSVAAKDAKDKVLIVKGVTTTSPASKEEMAFAKNSVLSIQLLQSKLNVPATAEEAKTKIKSLYLKLAADEELKKLLEAEKINSESEAEKILNALVSLKRNAGIFKKFDILNKINRIVSEFMDENKEEDK